MKSLKKIVMVLMVLSMIVVFAGPVHAGYKLMLCKVTGCSIDQFGTAQILLERQDQLRSKYFDIPPGLENMMMAIALTAMTSRKDVQAYVDWSQSAGSEILELRVIP